MPISSIVFKWWNSTCYQVQEFSSPVQVKNYVSVYIDRDSDRDSVRDRDKNNREKNYIDRDRDAK